MLGHPKLGLPCGQDRLIPVGIAAIAVSRRSRVVRLGAASEIRDSFRLFKTGKRYRRLVGGFQRVFSATMFFNEPVVTDFPLSCTPFKTATNNAFRRPLCGLCVPNFEQEVYL